jgi:hypothetical protein
MIGIKQLRFATTQPRVARTSSLEGCVVRPIFRAVVLLMSTFASVTLAEDSSVFGFTSVVMQRTACLGSCPVYTVKILSTGDVIYDGDEGVKITGQRVARIDSADLRALADAFEHIDFYSLHERYRSKKDGCVEARSDYPAVEIVISRAGKPKKVYYNYGCKGISAAQRIAWLSDKIDEVSRTAQWVGDKG